MPARTYDDEVFREKRKVKNPITFKLKLNKEQKLAKDVILSNTITLLAGKAGSGKTSNRFIKICTAYMEKIEFNLL